MSPDCVAFCPLRDDIEHFRRRVLLEMRRTKNELEVAREKFQLARTEFTNTLNTWSCDEQQQDLTYNQMLASGMKNIRDSASKHIKTALDDTLSEKVCIFTIYP